MTHTLFIMAALVTCAITAFLVFSCEYEDGLIGRIALMLICLGDFIIVMDGLVQGSDYGGILPTTLILQSGIALFFLRHAYRFLRWRRDETYDWRKAVK